GDTSPTAARPRVAAFPAAWHHPTEEAVGLWSRRCQYAREAAVDPFDVERLGYAAVLAGAGSFPGCATRVSRAGFGLTDLLYLDDVPPAVAEVVQVAR